MPDNPYPPLCSHACSPSQKSSKWWGKFHLIHLLKYFTCIGAIPLISSNLMITDHMCAERRWISIISCSHTCSPSQKSSKWWGKFHLIHLLKYFTCIGAIPLISSNLMINDHMCAKCRWISIISHQTLRYLCNKTPLPKFSIPGTNKTLQQHPNENEAHIMDADGMNKHVGEVSQWCNKLGASVGQMGTEAGQKVEDYLPWCYIRKVVSPFYHCIYLWLTIFSPSSIISPYDTITDDYSHHHVS